MNIELFVKLIVPDTTAITALHTLQDMGFSLESLERMDYYRFTLNGNEKEFSEKIKKVDVLVNANKHRAFTKKPEEPLPADGIKILVKNMDERNTGLLHTLQNRLGFKEILAVERGTLWMIPTQDKKLAEDIAKELLVNGQYQEYEVFY